MQWLIFNNIHIYLYIYIYLFMSGSVICVYIYTHMHMYVHTHIHIYTCMCMHVHIYMHARTYACVCMYTCMCVYMYIYLCICDVRVVSGAEIVEGGGKGKESFVLCSPCACVPSPIVSAEGAEWAGSVEGREGSRWAHSGQRPSWFLLVPPWQLGLFSPWTTTVPPWSLTVHKCRGTVPSKAYSLAHLANAISCSHSQTAAADFGGHPGPCPRIHTTKYCLSGWRMWFRDPCQSALDLGPDPGLATVQDSGTAFSLHCPVGMAYYGQVGKERGGSGSSKAHLSPYRRLTSHLPSPAPELSFAALKCLGQDALLSFSITSHHLGILKGAEVKWRTCSLRPLFQK